MNTLYWLTHDLRHNDNPALIAAARGDTLTCVYCIDEQQFNTDRFGNRRMGAHRWRFLRESLTELHNQLSTMGQSLNILKGSPTESISKLLATGRFDRVIRSRHHAFDEMRAWAYLKSIFPSVEFTEIDTFTLFKAPVLEPGQTFPASFSLFRRMVGESPYRALQDGPTRLPPPTDIDIDSRLIERPAPDGAFQGGFSAGEAHLADYFGTSAASHYKATRNELQGDRTSTTFSPWLSIGCISPIQVTEALRQYEQQHGANESTEWIEFELLWREFFSWYGKHHEHRLFTFSGVTGTRPLTTFYRERFLKWCNGETPWPIVNACMKELNATGFLSNRGRQIAASCLVNELGLDWRCGAGYFEQQLIDYDPCSNWGNWQYIAGVGADPRGGRHFNLEKQAETWDTDGAYRTRWASDTPTAPLDSFDYYGWPVEPANASS